MVYILIFADGYVTDDLSTPGVASGINSIKLFVSKQALW